MPIGTIDDSQRKAARIVGFAYLFAMATAIFGFYVRGQLVVAGDAAATALKIMGSEQLFRLGIASDLLTFVTDVALITALYVTLRPVNRNLALLATFWRLIETAVLVVSTLKCLDVLKLLGGAEYLRVFEVDRLQALARLSISELGAGYDVGFVFLGVGSTLFSYLWLRSRYIPMALAALGILASAVLAICHFTFIISPGFANLVAPFYMAPMGVFEIAMGFWLLFRGIRLPRTAEPGMAGG